MEGIFESNPLLGEQEKIMTASNNLEGEAYDWFLWWSKKCDARSFHWQRFTTAIIKRFYDEEDNALYNKFVHLKQKGNVNDYTHEWEVCYRANCRLGKARPNPLDGDNGGRAYPLSPQINPPSLCEGRIQHKGESRVTLGGNEWKVRVWKWSPYRSRY
jgi:hypothetical protein